MDEKTSLAEVQPGKEQWKGWERLFKVNLNIYCYQTRLIHIFPACVICLA